MLFIIFMQLSYIYPASPHLPPLKQKSLFPHRADFWRLLVLADPCTRPLSVAAFPQPCGWYWRLQPWCQLYTCFLLFPWSKRVSAPCLEFWAICLTLPCLQERRGGISRLLSPGWDHTAVLSPWWICLTLSNASWLWSHVMKSLKIESGREQRGALIIYWRGRIHTFCKETSFVVFWSIQFSLSQI